MPRAECLAETIHGSPSNKQSPRVTRPRYTDYLFRKLTAIDATVACLRGSLPGEGRVLTTSGETLVECRVQITARVGGEDGFRLLAGFVEGRVELLPVALQEQLGPDLADLQLLQTGAHQELVILRLPGRRNRGPRVEVEPVITCLPGPHQPCLRLPRQ